MSQAKDFNRVDDRPERNAAGKPDRFEQFKEGQQAALAYRDAYYRAQQAGVSLVGLPEPDGVRAGDVAEAMAKLEEAIRAGSTPRTLSAVPPIDMIG
jgi:hypothetical protein